MQRKQLFVENEFFHVFTRGVEKRKIFLDRKDYVRFTALLFILNQPGNFTFRDYLRNKKIDEIYTEERDTQLVSILSYCLMPNHFHILFYEHAEGGITKFMSRLLTAYSMYFNTKYKRSGPLFVRPFRSQHISSEPQYMYIFSYIHLNAVDLFEKDWKENGLKNLEGAEEFLNTFTYSSYTDYVDEKNNRPEKFILDFSKIPDYAKNPLRLEERMMYLQK